MAKQALNQLKAAVRAETGKGASRRARRDGKIPAVLYGHGAAPQHLELPGHDFAAVLRHAGTNAVLTLDIEGKEQLALTKSLDIHPIRRTIQHADLLVVRRGEKVTNSVAPKRFRNWQASRAAFSISACFDGSSAATPGCTK